MNDRLKQYGWDSRWQSIYDAAGYSDDNILARVTADHGKTLKIQTQGGKINAEVNGRMQYESDLADLPKVGDWVVGALHDDLAIVSVVLERRSVLERKKAGTDMQRQVLAANVDLAIVVQSADDDLSINRLKRYMFQLKRADIDVMFVINKIDSNDNWAETLQSFKAALPDCSMLALQATDADSLKKLNPYLQAGKTVVVLGSSGVGKSTIINGLLGAATQDTQDVRQSDSKGRHTTTHREMFRLPSGALLIDTPGVRELQLWGSLDDTESLDSHISDIAADCRFDNCGHSSEPGCQITAALENGVISQTDLGAFEKMKRELEYLNSKVDVAGSQSHKKKQKQLHKMYKNTVANKKNNQSRGAY